jgi:hypothetical protein
LKKAETAEEHFEMLKNHLIRRVFDGIEALIHSVENQFPGVFSISNDKFRT